MAGGIYSPEMVIKNALVDGQLTDIEITCGRISAVGKNLPTADCMTINAGGLMASAGRIYLCDCGGLDCEELLFSGFSTIVFRRRAASPSVSDCIKRAMTVPLNFAVLSDADAAVSSFSDGALPTCGIEIISDHVGAVEVGMLADIFLWARQGSLKTPEKIIKGGRLIFDRSISPRRDIIYAMSEPLRSVFFTTQADADSYIGKKLVGERSVAAIVHSDPP
ncbi:hypothetical protein [Ruminococcus sp.]|uniref:hypothetical protein n=1 Tax=Ruminococcus sp. TaxID=41978 RepID=UPI001B0E3625|nr:hypothetical protein [Ruminococcus sp.]MBO5557143.1 hypothetical protein [Ruminococcus sp.]